MFITVTGVGIHLFHLFEEDGFLRAVVYTSKAEFAIAFHRYACGCQLIVAARTYFGTDAAIDAGVRDEERVLAMHQKSGFRVDA